MPWPWKDGPESRGESRSILHWMREDMMSEWNLIVDGKVVTVGQKLADFRGDTLYFRGIEQPPSPGKSGKCYFSRSKAAKKEYDRNGRFAWSVYYPGVVDGEIVQA